MYVMLPFDRCASSSKDDHLSRPTNQDGPLVLKEFWDPQKLPCECPQTPHCPWTSPAVSRFMRFMLESSTEVVGAVIYDHWLGMTCPETYIHCADKSCQYSASMMMDEAYIPDLIQNLVMEAAAV